jgi:hypothetical protein
LVATARHITLNPVVEKFLAAWRIALLPSIPVGGQTTSNMSLKRSRKVCTSAQVTARLKRMIHRKFYMATTMDCLLLLHSWMWLEEW